MVLIPSLVKYSMSRVQAVVLDIGSDSTPVPPPYHDINLCVHESRY